MESGRIDGSGVRSGDNADARRHELKRKDNIKKEKRKARQRSVSESESTVCTAEREALALIRNPHKEVSKHSLIVQYIDEVAAAQASRDDLVDPANAPFAFEEGVSLNNGPANGIVGLWDHETDAQGEAAGGATRTLPATSNSAILNQLVISHCGDSNDRTVAKSFITWESRPTFPKKGFTLSYFRDLMSVKFWERIDWTIRCALLCITPVSILTLHPNTIKEFVLPGFVMDSALWVTAPTLGEGLREVYFAIKGFGISIGALAVLIQALPSDPEGYIFVLGMFLAVLITAFLAPEVKKTSAYGIAVLMFAGLTRTVDYQYLLDFWKDTLIGFAMGMPAFFIPFPVQSHTRALRYCGILANNISSAIQGVCDSFWTTSMQREFNLIRLRVLQTSIGKALDEVDKMMAALIYELHSGVTVARLDARRNLLMKLMEIVRAGTVLIEDIAKQPWNVETRTCEMMGARLGGMVRLLATSVDQLLLKIADCNVQLSKRDFIEFERTYADFEEEVRVARSEMMLLNDGYEPEVADIYLGTFLFLLHEICVLVGGFQDPTDGPSIFWRVWVRAPYDWIRDTFINIIYICKALLNQELPRKVKEALKLGGAMSISALYQFYSGSLDPISGTPIVPWIYQRTGADSFHYAINRVLGTVIGSVCAFIGAEAADGHFWWLIFSIAVVSCAGAFIQTSPINTILGNAMLWSTISISSQYSSRQAAAKRIQTNVFAVIVYLVVASLVWPIRATSRIFFECESSLRAFRDATSELCSGLSEGGAGADYIKVVDRSGGMIKDFKRRIDTQVAYLRASGTEPTLAGNPFPTEQWSKMIRCLYNLHSVLGTMQFAYFSFKSSSSVAFRTDGDESSHAHLANVMGECARLVGNLLASSADLYIILLRNAGAVSTNHLVRLRVRLIQALTEMQDTFCSMYKGIIFEMIDEDGNAVHEGASEGRRRVLKKTFFTLDEFQQGVLSAEHGDYSDSSTSDSDSTSASASGGSSRSGSSRSSDTQGNRSADKLSLADTILLNKKADPVTRRLKAFAGQDAHGVAATNALSARLREGANAIMGLDAAAGHTFDGASDLGGELHAGLAAREEAAGQREKLARDASTPQGAVREAGAGVTSAAQVATEACATSAPALTADDVHSLQTFLFGVGALVMEAGELEKAILEMKNAQEIFMKI